MASENPPLIQRQYFQVYADFNYYLRSPRLLAAIINALVPLKEIQIQSHQTRVLLEGDVEVKIGYDPFIQVSCPDDALAKKTFNKILESLRNELKETGVEAE